MKFTDRGVSTASLMVLNELMQELVEKNVFSRSEMREALIAAARTCTSQFQMTGAKEFKEAGAVIKSLCLEKLFPEEPLH